MVEAPERRVEAMKKAGDLGHRPAVGSGTKDGGFMDSEVRKGLSFSAIGKIDS